MSDIITPYFSLIMPDVDVEDPVTAWGDKLNENFSKLDVLGLEHSIDGTHILTKIDHGGIIGLGDDDHIQYLPVNGTRGMSSNLSLGNYRIVDLEDPIDAKDAVNKDYLDNNIMHYWEGTYEEMYNTGATEGNWLYYVKDDGMKQYYKYNGTDFEIAF